MFCFLFVRYFCLTRTWPGALALTGTTNQDGTALEHVSQEMKGDRELCMAAVRNSYGGALEHMSDALKNDETIVLAALEANPYKKYRQQIVQMASTELEREGRLLAAVAQGR